MKSFISRNPSATGFTLVETMIAVTILTLAISGALFAANTAIIAANIARDQLIASHLAQEGIEYVRLMRDNEYLAAYQAGGANVSSVAWSNFLTGSDTASIAKCRAPKTCTLGLMQGNGTFILTSCPSGGVCTEPFVLMEKGTPFTRTIQAIDVSENDKRIVSTVRWSFHSIPYSVSVADHLTPWQ